MKSIGIVGGLSLESTVLYYMTIIREFRHRFSSEKYPNMVIYSVNFEEFTESISRGNYEKALSMLLNALHSLHRAGRISQ